MIALLVATALAGNDVTGTTLALLRIALDGPEVAVAVTDTPQHGRLLTVDCVSGCATPLHYEDPQDDLPLGLFQPFDREPIVMSVWAGGSVYHVRAYRLTATKVERVLDIATRSAPSFRLAPDGAIQVGTTERRDERAGPLVIRNVTWTWRRGLFTRGN